MSNKICVCGHSILVHTPVHLQDRRIKWIDYIKDACYEGNLYNGLCPCEKFKLDNLRWLEEKAEDNI